MKKLVIINLMLYIALTASKATNNLRSPDVRTLGTGGNAVVHSSLFNPALLALYTQKEIRLDYYNRYALKELATVSGSFSFPNKILPAGFHIASFGYDGYRESLFRLSFGKQLNQRFSLGVGVQYALLQSDLFETAISRLATDIGISILPADNWLIGVSIINIPSIALTDGYNDKKYITPFLIQAGIRWQFINDMLITAGAACMEETPFTASVGTEYTPFPDFQLRMGISTHPLSPSAGVSYRIAMLTADVVAIYHPVLGISTGIGLSFAF